MSTVIMSACWPLGGMSASQKAVLISLADNANDEGVCWPSIARIAERTCLSERAVQGAIKALTAAGYLVVQPRQGHSTMFRVTPAGNAPQQMPHPRRKCTPADAAPPQEMHPTPADAAPPPPQMLHPTPADAAPRTVIEPSVEPSENHQSFAATSGEVSPPAVQVSESTGATEKPARLPASKLSADEIQQACREVWNAYADAYEQRYGTAPVRNAKINGQVRQLVQRLGRAEAPPVAAFYVRINDAFLIRRAHELGALIASAEGYRTQWATNRQINGVTARQIENTQANVSAAHEAAARIHAGVVHDNPFLR